MKKSNQPEAARQFKRFGGLTYGRTLGHSPTEEYNHIMEVAYLLSIRSRQEAIEYLQGHRPWLKDFLGTMGTNLPASGALLDSIITTKALKKQ